MLNSDGSLTTTNLGNGTNWLVCNWPHLCEQLDDLISVVFDTCRSYWFQTTDGSTFTAQFGAKQTLTLASGIYSMTSPDGYLWQFNGAGGIGPIGSLNQVMSPGGDTLAVTGFNSAGRITGIDRMVLVGADTITESYSYDYLPAGDPNAGLLASVTLLRQTSPSCGIRRAVYTYYTSAAI